jgi:hypothetical protein
MHSSIRSSAFAIYSVFCFGHVTNVAFAQQATPNVPEEQPSAEAPGPNSPPALPAPPPSASAPDAPPPYVVPPPTNPTFPPPVAPPLNPPYVLAPTAAPPVVTPPKPKFPTRSLRIAPSMQVLLFKPFPYAELSRVGTGVFAAYEFFLKPSSVIGINLSYRYFPGKADLHQVGYGLLLKHYLGGMDSLDSTFMPYVEYGLLLQINKLSTRLGTGTAHDTRLSAGTDVRISQKIFFVEASYHYSRLGLFEQVSERLDNIEFNLGYRYPW